MKKTLSPPRQDLSHITPAVLPEAEAARYIGMSTHYLRQSRHLGNESAPPYVKAGRSVRYLLRDLDAWLNSNRVEIGPEVRR